MKKFKYGSSNFPHPEVNLLTAIKRETISALRGWLGADWEVCPYGGDSYCITYEEKLITVMQFSTEGLKLAPHQGQEQPVGLRVTWLDMNDQEQFNVPNIVRLIRQHRDLITTGLLEDEIKAQEDKRDQQA